MSRRVAVGVLTTTSLIGALVSLPSTADARGRSTDVPHVVVFGLDGVRWDKLAANAPRINGLIKSGYGSPTSLYANPMAPTSSGPGWGTNATGVWPDKHKITSNDFPGNDLKTYPDFLTRLERVDPAFTTYAATDWAPLGQQSSGGPIFSDAIDRKYSLDGDTDGYPVTDPKIATDAANHISKNAPRASFVYFGNVDEAGHEHGGASPEYAQAVRTADAQVGKVIDAIKTRPRFAQEKWQFIVTTDHGHTDAGGHGGSSVEERTSFIVASGAGIPATGTPAIRPKNVDVAATVFQHLGVKPPASWGLDGRPINAVSRDPFDTMIGSLGARVDETGVPADVRGWTHSVPTGWSIDNSAMGTGGVTEWQGWSLTTDEFWTRAAPDQQRESNVRSRGVFAVADSDEWSDKATSGPFNSALVTPAYDVRGRAAVSLGFVSHYLKDGDETAAVSVSFDGGPERNVLTYTGDRIAATEKLSVAVPSGAQKMTVKFRLSNGVNNWYWAIDDVTVS
ncbi:nucleotide pyrophosphatase [Luteipulveratus mongoliensis]|uniref:Nucleotide pyrophosphatase n=2 Tax=Luteipulveratus mongoliensis TaxID=571913 RepID=A0A0K1JPZ5_9MICO|nr:nucleotide pyrophosphatase [Luteipulveratus mongoliensis]